MPALGRRVLELVGKRQVVYLRELQLLLEDDFAHWDVQNEAIRLQEAGELKTRSYKRQRWYFSSDMNWEDVKQEVERKSALVQAYIKHRNYFDYEGKRYDDYSEFLVEGAFRQAGYLIVSRNTNYFDGKIYLRAERSIDLSRRGRPADLDFIVLVKERLIPVGVQVKNRLDYPEKEHIDEFLAMCTALDLRPLLVVRMAHEKDLGRVALAHGRVVVYKRWLMRPPFPREVFDQLLGLGLPFSIYQYTPDFLVKQMAVAKSRFLSSV